MKLVKLIILTALWTGASCAMEKESMDTVLGQKLFSKEKQLEESKKIDRLFSCEYCTTLYIDKKSLKCHEQKKHPIEFVKNYPYICELDDCGKRFANKTDINIHNLRIHSVGKFNCEYCKLSYTQQKILNRHQQAAHPTEYGKKATNMCKICNRAFTSKDGLNLHRSKMHKNPTHSLEKNSDEIDNQKSASALVVLYRYRKNIF